jgi:uncharacterized protein YndB with AHSA1/START domain
MNLTAITVSTLINADIALVWDFWTNPVHITKWNFASETWECPRAISDLRVGGEFVYTLSSKDKTVTFDLPGVYTKIEPLKSLNYTLGGRREVIVNFEETGDGVEVTETFETEPTHTLDEQRAGWQAILDNFKRYCECENKD